MDSLRGEPGLEEVAAGQKEPLPLTDHERTVAEAARKSLGKEAKACP